MDAPRITVERARALRRTLTLPEVILWQAIRGGRLGGARFRRQHPLGPYILDFYCDAAGLAVEVDGFGHDHPDQRRHDARRTEWLNARGVSVHRIAAGDVLGHPEGVLAAIRRRVGRAAPPSLRYAASPSSERMRSSSTPKGED